MSVSEDPRVDLHKGVWDTAYEIGLKDGIADVCQIDGKWVLFPVHRPEFFNASSNESYQAWQDSLPRYETAELAVAAALQLESA